MRTLVSCALSALGAASAAAAPVTIQSTDSVYNYDGSSTAGYKSTTPPIVSLAAGTSYLTFASTGSVYLTPPTTYPSPYGYHGPDGSPPASMNVTAANNLSGIVSPNVGYVAGVFLNGAEGSQPTPASLDFSPSGEGEAFASLAPSVDQVFFIGDGLTGTSSGSLQQFLVPTGATKLVLGIVDAYGYNGVPGAYYDNDGQFQVTVTPHASAVPEAASWLTMIAGMGLVGAVTRFQRKKRICVI